MSPIPNTRPGQAVPAGQTSTPGESHMQGPNKQVEQIVADAIGQISHIATLPEVTMRIIQLVEDPDSTAQDLNKVITNDPALGARILKVVNSAFYGLPGQIGSINRAIVLLGLNAVKNIAIAASLAKLFRGGRICPQFDARELWTFSISSATATRLLADRVGLGLPDEAFLAGLIHDLGIMVEVQAARPKFAEVMQKLDDTEGATLRQVETEVFGADHEQFGAGLCKLWKFPQSFAYVTGFHHRPSELPENHRTLATLVHIAEIICAQQKLGFTRSVETLEIDPGLMSEVGLTEAYLKEVHDKLPEAVDEASGIFHAPEA